MLKRGLSATVKDLLMSAEYILAGGNKQVILCERGIRSFDASTRNLLDLAMVPNVKGTCHLPVVVDPSHGTGRPELIPPMALAAVAAGADGVHIEVHTCPERALSDGEQALLPQQYADVMRQIEQGPQTAAMQERLRQLQEQRRQIQEYLTRGSAITVGNSVPAFVSLALGSAYFRLEQWPDAERAYKEAIAADPRTGEAHNNLAVVYLLTERYREAEAEVRAAEKAGYRVPQGLKDDIRKKKGS